MKEMVNLTQKAKRSLVKRQKLMLQKTTYAILNETILNVTTPLVIRPRAAMDDVKCNILLDKDGRDLFYRKLGFVFTI